MYRAILKHVNPSSRGFMLKKQFLSGTFAILSVLVIIIPIVFLGIELSRQVIDFANYMNGYFAEHGQMRIDAQNPIVAFISQLSGGRFDLSNLDIKKELLLFLERSANTIFTLSTSVVKNVGGFAINLVFMIFTLFFFYLDGDYLLDLFMKAIPIDKSYMQDFVSKFKETSKHLIQGYFLVSLIQGCIAFIIFTLFGVKNALLLSVVLYFCSFIPMIGASAVWLPIGLIRIFQGELFLGVFFLLVSGFFISLLDNFLRPFFLKDRIKVHPLLIFFSILGGVRAFGFNGLILGPMILMLFFTALDIFIRIYKTDRFDKKGSAESGEESP
jgi:predicted PurR-regulated permease PerM